MQQADSTNTMKEATPCLPKRRNSTTVRPRAVLSKSEVIDIFNARLTLKSATTVARFYGVSEKAIRDIWTGRTWAAETWHLDMSRPLKVKLSGRPLGSRDSRPRKQRQATEHSHGSAKQVAALRAESINKCACGPYDTRFDSEDFSASIGYGVCDMPPQNCQAVRPCIELHDHNSDDSAHICSIDDQLLYWEHVSVGEQHVPDPFEADWTRARVQFL